jgi:transposase
MRSPAPVNLSNEQRQELESWTRGAKIEARQKERAHIILLAADGLNNAEIADELGIHQGTPSKWRSRFNRLGIEGLSDAPRPGRPREITPELERQVLALTPKPPKNRTNWSTRSMAKRVGTTDSNIRIIWKRHDLKPHLVRKFKLSNDPDFVEKVHDIVGLYLNPPDNAIVFSLDEKSQIQALDRSQPILPIRPGLPEHQAHDYKRHGTTSLFAAMDVASGKTIAQLHLRHRAAEFIDFLEEIDRQTPDDKELCVILDNYITHKTKAVNDWLEDHPRFKFFFTPTGSSWINMVERLFSKLTTERIRRGVFRSVENLEDAIVAWVNEHNADPRPFKWTKSAKEIVRKVEKYRRTYAALH